MKIVGNKGRLRAARKVESFTPMEGVGNMADAMLVFACGILLALILSGNVAVNESGMISNPSNMSGGINPSYEVDGVEDGVTEEISGEDGLEEIGTVYRDPSTGKYYVVEGNGTGTGAGTDAFDIDNPVDDSMDTSSDSEVIDDTDAEDEDFSDDEEFTDDEDVAEDEE